MRSFTIFAIGASALYAGSALGANFADSLVQSPTIRSPQRGSVSGSLSSFALEPGDLVRGTMSVPLSIDLPDDRGAAGIGLAPAYTYDGGLSEWGMGFTLNLTIRRFAVRGEIDYTADEFTSPWGPLRQGNDGYFYLKGLTQTTRFERLTGGWVVTTPDGARFDFDVPVQTLDGTYAWFLGSVRTLVGDETRLSYAINAYGRPFLASVYYGDRGHPDAYRVDLIYDNLAHPFLDFRPGAPYHLDRRVARVEVRMHDGSGSYPLRWQHDLGYEESPLGPAFYLTSMVKKYASGATEPAHTFAYEYGNYFIDNVSTLEQIDGSIPFVSTLGPEVLQPDYSAFVDLDRDGRLDLEYKVDQRRFRKTDAGWSEEALPANPSADLRCRDNRGALNPVRSLVRPDPIDPTLRVLAFSPVGSETEVVLCDELGNHLHDIRVPGAWAPSASNRVVDIDRDGRPDLIRVTQGGFASIRGIGDVHSLAFQPEVSGALSPAVAPDALWVHDMNGDSIADLVVRGNTGLYSWSGLGGGSYETAGRPLILRFAWGGQVSVLAAYHLSFVDVNRDGLIDVILTTDSAAYVFTNRGVQNGTFEFQEISVPALAQVPGGLRSPIVADLDGSGEDQVVFTESTGEVYTVKLTSPYTGVLYAWDDGKGSVLLLSPNRMPAQPGIRFREVRMEGYTLLHGNSLAPATYAFDYGPQVLHSEDHYLLGFERVARWSPSELRISNFQHSDDASVLLDEATFLVTSPTVDFDPPTGAVSRYSSWSYDAATHAGVPFLRQKSERSGYRQGGSDLFEETTYLRYERSVCPVEVETANQHGRLVWSTSLARVPNLPGDRHCMAERQEAVGHHSDSTLDFREAQRIERDAFGLVTAVIREGSTGPQYEQRITYDGLRRISRIDEPTGDFTEARYNLLNGLIEEIETADGVIIRIASRDPATDSILRTETLRGGAPYVEEFSFDAMERLGARWRPGAGSSSTDPESRFSYSFAESGRPGSIAVDTRVAPGIVARNVDYIGGHGRTVAQALRIPQGWKIRESSDWTPNAFRTTHYASNAVAASLPSDVTYADLYAARQAVVGAETGSPLGFDERVEWMNPGISGATDATLQVVPGAVEISRTNSGITESTIQDATGRVLAFVDGGGERTEFAYDAMGRLIRVRLPSGLEHDARFDDYGRIAIVDRDDVGRILYRYDPTTGLMTSKEVFDALGTLDRTVVHRYDVIGRLVEEEQTLAATGVTATYRLFYDGAPVGTAGQLGFLTGATGPDHTVETIYHPDTTVAQTTETFGGAWRVQNDFGYFENRDVRTRRRIVTDMATGVVLEDTTREDVLDAHGRLHRVLLNGTGLLELKYDLTGPGLLRTILLPNGQRDLYYDDAATLKPTGFSTTDSGVASGIVWQMDARGFVGQETVNAAGATWMRSYSYSNRGFLEGQHDSNGRLEGAWQYDADGLPTYSEDLTGARTITRSPGMLQAGGTTYLFDDLGRVIERDGDRFTYGPSGRIETAQIGPDTIEMSYDRAGNRILKRKNGAVVAAYVGGAHLSAGGFIEALRVDGALIGILDGGVFKAVHADRNGSLIVDEAGNPAPMSAYGARTHRTGLMEALDFVGKGFDRDLKTIRMGIRDYDPALGQFWSPDPMFLEEIDRCLESAVECNLYGYARGNPITFVDPTGNASAFSDWVFEKTDSWIVAGTVGTLGDIGTTVVHMAYGSARTAVMMTNPVTAVIVAKESVEGFHDLGVRWGVGTGQIFHGAESGNNIELARGLGTTAGALGETIFVVLGARGGVRQVGRVRAKVPPPKFRCSFVGETAVATAAGLVLISEIQVGDRVLTPETSDGTTAPTAVTDDWIEVHVEVRASADPSHVYQLVLLRPQAWLDGQDQENLAIDIEELDVSGVGRIVSVAPAPVVAEGPGSVVLVTMRHRNADLFQLVLTGASRALVATGSHPLFSVDRGDWVLVEDVREGERLQTKTGETIVESKEALPGERWVYNLNVEGEHEYLVGDSEVRAHNFCYERLKGLRRYVRGLAHEIEQLARTKGNSGPRAHRKPITTQEANRLGRAWVGPGAKRSRGTMGSGERFDVWTSKDGLRQYRSPTMKGGRYPGRQANFEQRSNTGMPFRKSDRANVHVRVSD